MKPIFLWILFSIYVFDFSIAQNPLVKMWDKRFGGTSFEFIYSFQQANDGGYILGGDSYSKISGDKTQDTIGSFDYWIVKTDSVGNKQWDKNFGGTDWDELYSMQQTSDDGFILGGYSRSGIGGDKTENCLDTGITNFMHGDFWIIKTDSLGNKEWDKRFGGTEGDEIFSIIQTNDGGYLLGGTSNSGISGDKTQASWDTSQTIFFHGDYWIVKTDSIGNKQWDRRYGGNSIEYLSSIQQTTDGGYILGGISESDISGDKTCLKQGSVDYWIVKIDSLGNKEWDKSYGGLTWNYLYSLHQTNDGGYILGGLTSSGIGGDKTEPLWGNPPDHDYWIVKTDSFGNKQWDKDFGGLDDEREFGSVNQTIDSGYLIAGLSFSDTGGNKTENNLAPAQTWVLKIDSIGNMQWDKTLLINGKVGYGLAIQTSDGCYAMADYNAGTIAGYKTQNSWGGSDDYWIIKFCDSTTILPNAFVTATQNLCPGTCTNFLNLTLYATSYQWNFPGATPDTSTDINPSNICYASPGSYSVTLIATNANGSDTLTLQNYITVFPQPAPQSITQSGDTLFAIAGASAYQWYFNGNIIPGATNYFYEAQSSGDYNVVATDTNGCEVEAVINNVIASSQFPVPSSQFVIFPNPVTDKFTIHDAQFTIGTANTEISIFNVFGEKINLVINSELSAKSDPSFGGWTVDCRSLSPGIYYIEITTNNKTFRSKFLKQ